MNKFQPRADPAQSHRTTPATGGLTDPSTKKPDNPAGTGAVQDRHIALAGAQRALLDSLPDVTWMKTVDGTLTAVNAAFGERYGMTPEQAVGKTDFDIYSPEKARQLREEDAQVIASRQPPAAAIRVDASLRRP